jgi:hypothetical protein
MKVAVVIACIVMYPQAVSTERIWTMVCGKIKCAGGAGKTVTGESKRISMELLLWAQPLMLFASRGKMAVNRRHVEVIFEVQVSCFYKHEVKINSERRRAVKTN